MIKALQRGVKIKLILAGRSDVGIAKNAERFLYRWAFRNGIEIYEYKQNILHGKMAVYDRKMITLGSYNINDISAKASIELNVDVEEKIFATNAQEILNKIMINECEKMSQELYARSIFDQLSQWFSYEIYKIVFTIFTFYFKKDKRMQPLS
jgi:cardiolipin synthase